nr:branched-chain amino acid ABC transporter permease [uncultured Devosia sp.]
MSRTDTIAGAPANAPTGKIAGVTTFRQQAVRIGIVVTVLLLGSFLLSGQPFLLNIAAYTFLFAGLATSWNIIGGYGGQFSLLHGAFFAIGGYTTANLYIHFQVSPWLALMPAALLAGLVGALVCWPLFRLKGKFFGIATMAVSEVALVLANYFQPLTGGPQGMSLPFNASFLNMIFTDRFSYALLMLGFLAFTLFVSGYVFRSRLGYYLQAVRDDQDAARASGIDVTRVKLTGMALSAAMTGMGGVLFVMYLRFIDPPTFMSLPDIGVRFLLISLIGGVGTVFGPLIGALLIVPVEFQLRAWLGGSVPGGHLVVLGFVLVLCALFLKRGIVGAALSAWERVRRNDNV